MKIAACLVLLHNPTTREIMLCIYRVVILFMSFVFQSDAEQSIYRIEKTSQDEANEDRHNIDSDIAVGETGMQGGGQSRSRVVDIA